IADSASQEFRFAGDVESFGHYASGYDHRPALEGLAAFSRYNEFIACSFKFRNLVYLAGEVEVFDLAFEFTDEFFPIDNWMGFNVWERELVVRFSSEVLADEHCFHSLSDCVCCCR